MTEPRLRLAITWLLQGDAGTAACAILENIALAYTSGEYWADPADIGYLIISLLCMGDKNKALELNREYASIHHPILDCVRLLDIAQARPSGPLDTGIVLASGSQLAISAHQLHEGDKKAILTEMLRILDANLMHTEARRIRNTLNTRSTPKAVRTPLHAAVDLI